MALGILSARDLLGVPSILRIVLGFGVALIATSTAFADIAIDQDIVDPKYDVHFQRMQEEERFSGVALVIIDGEVRHAKGYGLARDRMPNAVTTAFHVASITKQFTAAAVLQLVEREQISLTSSINSYLPEVYRSASWNAVTVHHLLSHTGGVPDYAVERDYYNVVDGFCLGHTVDGMINEAMSKELEFDPGSEFRYSNIGYTLLGLAIENQTSMPYHEYIRRHVLEPMGMSSSRIHVEGHTPVPDEAAGHRWDDVSGSHIKDDVVSLPVTAPDGGLITTLQDFANWTKLYLDGQQNILEPASIERMTTPAIQADGRDARGTRRDYGYGLFLGDDTVGHEGYIVGFRSHFIVDRSNDMVIAVFANNTTNNPRRITGELLLLIDAEPSRMQ